MTLVSVLVCVVLAPHGLTHRLPAAQKYQPRLIITLSGQELANRSAQDGLLFAVPWKDLVSQLFPQRDVQVLVEYAGQGALESDARSRSFDPERARFLLARAEFKWLKLRCEPNVCHVVNWLTPFLEAVGIRSPPPEVFDGTFRDDKSGESVLSVRVG